MVNKEAEAQTGWVTSARICSRVSSGTAGGPGSAQHVLTVLCNLPILGFWIRT